MKLKSIKLAGFKSFVDPTTIPIHGQLNGVVGPNGCGKSNVIDAVRWVIGESSAKQLRGQSMADVIFNGTTERKPVGLAAVELLFENNDGRLQGEYAAFSEISVRRQVERDGGSTYFLNGTVCRRSDVVTLFLGTGLGARSYAIIEQGMISRLIEAKPEEMRRHIEEAAGGISVYKERRRDTENRMRRTRENLDRLNDVREEVEKQLRHLDRQAKAAERYKILKEEQRRLQAEIKALQWQTYNETLVHQEQAITQTQNEYEACVAKQREGETGLEKEREAWAQASDAEKVHQKTFYKGSAEIARLEEQLQNHRGQLEGWKSELEESQILWDELKDNQWQHEERISVLESAVSEMAPGSDNLDEGVAAAQATLGRTEADRDAAETQWQKHEDRFNETLRRAQVSKAALEHYEAQQRQLSERLERFHADNVGDLLTQATAAAEPLAAQQQELAQVVNTTQATLETLSGTIQTKRDTLHSARTEIETQQDNLHSLKARMASLVALQKAAMGDDNDALNAWLAEKGLSQHQRLGKTITVPTQWQQALEVVLGQCLDAVCVDEMSSDLEFAEGVTLIEKVSRHSAAPTLFHGLSTLASQVTSDWPLDDWLSRVFLVPSINEAQILRAQLSPGQSLITPEGAWFGATWVRMPRQLEDEDRVLWREDQIRQLEVSLCEAQATFAQATQAIESNAADLTRQEEEREQLQLTYREQMQALADAKAACGAQHAEKEALEARRAHIGQEIRCVEEELQALEVKFTEASSQSQAAISEQARLEAEKTNVLEIRRTRRQQFDEARDVVQQLKQQQDEFDIRLSSSETQLDLLRQTFSREQRQLQQLSERRKVLEANLSQADGPLVEYEGNLEALLERHRQDEVRLREAQAVLSGVQERIQNFEQARQSDQEAIMSAQQALEKCRMESQATKVRQSGIIDQLKELDIDLDAVLAELVETAELATWQEEAERVEKRIQRLGPINLAAIEEQKVLSERQEYLVKQHADLTEALEVLEAAIRRIDTETKTKFKETFDQINAQFMQIFPRVFGGGQAELILDGDDLLTSGIIVKAQPPGKRNVTIHMLSGGEKALTAIALVFAFFELNPAPFCILDEVDAPLDDTNVGRYCELLKVMSDKVQFLVISHNKVTIEMMDYLMGVTMQEPGVSRIVSVDMEQAISMVDETEELEEEVVA